VSAEQFETGSKILRGRGRAKKTLDLIEAMYAITEAAQPITGRGVGYKLFTSGLIPSMARSEMQKVYRLLKEAREEGTIPWEWIVDESRGLERRPSWDDPEEYARATIRDYRRDYWDQQPRRAEVWSEKGTIRGVLQPVLDEYGVGFRVMHGFGSATEVYGIAQDDDGRSLTALYVGDWDPSGLCMSEHDLPERLERYDGEHVELERIALKRDDLADLPCSRRPTKRKTRAIAGLSRTTAIIAGSWTRSIPTYCASALGPKSKSVLSLKRGAAARRWNAQSGSHFAR
jgi:hypothetical protein